MPAPSPRLLALTLATLLSAAAGTARADVTVPGYVETCTMAKQSNAALECHECRAFYGNHTHCPDSLESYGFTQQCRAGGASVWSEIWCRGKSPTAAKVPPEVIGQLSHAQNKIKPGPALASPPATTPPATPTPPTTPTPPAAPTASAPVVTDAPAPPPVPPPQGCGCSVVGDGDGPLAASLLAMIAAVTIAIRRKRRA